MRVRRRGLTRNVVFFVLLVLAHPATAQQIPPGYDLRTDPRVSGALLVNARPGSWGATALMRQSLGGLRLFPVMLTCVGSAAALNRMRAGGEL